MRGVSRGLRAPARRGLGNVSGVQNTPAAQRVVGLGLGAVVLGLLIVLAVALPKAQGDAGTTPAELPATLPGGWTATDELDVADLPAEAGIDEEAIQRQADLRDYAEEVYAGVYDDAPSFRSYTDKTLQKYALVTVFAGESHAFLPDAPPIDAEVAGAERSGTDLVREGDALCSASYQLVQAGQDAGEPTSVTCQLPTAGRTIQLEAQGVSVDDSFTLLDEIAAAIA